MESIKKIIESVVILIIMLFFMHLSNELNKDAIWFRNMDQDSMNLIGALDVNAGNTPVFNEHPGLGTYFLYGKVYEFLKFIDLVEISSLKELETHIDPILVLPNVYLTGRKISIGIAILCSLIFAYIIYLQFKSYALFLVAFSCMLFSKGILFQSLVIRNELVSLLFFLISLLFCQIGTQKNSITLFFLTGLFSCFAYFTKIQILPFLLVNVLFILSTPTINKNQIYRSNKALATLLFIMACYLIVVLKRYEVFYLDICLYINLVISIINVYLHYFFKKGFLKEVAMGISAFLSAFFLGIIMIKFVLYNNSTFPNRFLAILQNCFFDINSRAMKHISFDLDGLIKQNPFLSIFDIYHSNLLLISSLIILGLIIIKDKIQAKRGILLLGAFIFFAMFNLLRKSKTIMFIKVTYLCYTDFFLICSFIFCAGYLLKAYKQVGKVILLCVIVANSILINIDLSKYYPNHNITFANAYDAVGTCIYQIPNFKNIMFNKYDNRATIEHRIISDLRLNGSSRGIDIHKVVSIRKKHRKKRKVNK